MKTITEAISKLSSNRRLADFLFILWAGGAALLSYSLVYTLRKPFTAATFDGIEAFGFDYKVLVTIIQIAGYLIAKFIGIKLISELKRENRLKFILVSIAVAELSLVAFGALPTPYNMFAMFFNGLSLGCMWGVIFSFIEGRRTTDILASLLGISIVISSGTAKSIGLFVMNTLNVSEFWMPALIGAFALPLLALLGYSLTRLPQPTAQDIEQKSSRVTLNGKQRKELFIDFMPFLVLLFVANLMLVVLRDIKEDFLVKIIDINGPHQGGWVDTNTGESWFIHFQDKGAYGRVIHLNPMTWVNDWPVIGVDKDKDGCGEPVTTYKKPNVGKTYLIATPPESDEFNTRHLGLQWQWHANKKDTYGFTTDLGYIRLYAGSLSKEFVNFWEVPNLLMQKFPAEEFTATTKLTFTAKQDGEQTGIIVMGWDYSYLSIRKEGDQFILQQAVCKDAEQQNPEQIKELANIPVEHLKMPGVADNEWQTVYLQVKVRKGAVCTFAYSLDGKKYTTVGEPFTARQGKWIGAKVGVFCVTPNEGNRGWADVDWFRMTK